MWMSSHVSTYDCLDRVHVSAQVWEDPGNGEPKTLVLQAVCDVQGEGVTDPKEWLKDALIGLVETL